MPQIQDSFHASVTALGVAHVPIALGQFVAFFVARQADRVGRRPLLLVTVLGYTVFTAATAAAWDLASFAVLQFGAQVFIGAEFGVAVTMLVEVFPKQRRGRALGVLLTFGPLGAVVVAVLLASGAQQTALGWRLFYLIGLLPLVVVAIGRRRLPETAQFQQEQRRRAEGTSAPQVLVLEPWLPPYRGRLVLVGLVSLLQTLPTSAAVAWWAYYAERERGLGTGQVATYVILAYGAGLFGYYCCGRLMDRAGRRRTGVTYIVCTVAAGTALFQSGNDVATPVLLAVAVFFGLGIGPVLSAYATELFPTRTRAEASSWARNWFAVVGSALGPALVGVLGDPYHGAIGNIGNTVSLLMLVAVPAAFLIWRYMPETRGADLGAASAPSAAAPSAEYSRLRRSFAIGLSVVVLALGAAFGIVLTVGSGQQRPSGAAQDWLYAIAGTTASSGRQGSLDQAVKLGAPALAGPLIVHGTTGQAAFTRIVVGKSKTDGNTATVPFTVVRPSPPALAGTIGLHRSATGWRVVAVRGVHEATVVPAPASPALPGPALAWVIGAIVVVFLIGAAASSAVRRAGVTGGRPGSA